MPRIVIASDIHYDDELDLTPPATVSALATRAASLAPDAVALAGDLGHPFRNFEACLRHFGRFDVPVGVVAGNHDIWRDPEAATSSAELWRRRLPDAVRAAGMAWLEQDTILVGRTAVVGSTAWYDYSAVDRSLRLADEQIVELKQHATNDSVWIDFPWSDQHFADVLRVGLLARLEALEWDDTVDRVVLVTHVPLFEEQMVRRTDEASWGLMRAYFGNLRTGAAVLRFPKLAAVVSGHTHRPVAGRPVERSGATPVAVHVVGSDYGEPGLVVLDLPDDLEQGGSRRIRRGPPPWFA